MNKKVFKVKIQDKEVEFAVLRPDHKAFTKAQLYQNKVFREALESGAITRTGVEKTMRDQNLWDDKKEEEFKQLEKKILDGEKTLLKKGGIKLSEAKEIALEMRRARARRQEMSIDRNRLDMYTAEAQAENARFNSLVASCTVNNDDGKPYFKDVEDYLNKGDDEVAIKAAGQLGMMLYGLEEDYQHKWPENIFLKKYKLCDDKLRLINKEGKYVDEKGRRVDKDGYLVNDKDEFIDIEGNVLTKDGELKGDPEPFLDDDGKPIVVDVKTDDLNDKVE